MSSKDLFLESLVNQMALPPKGSTGQIDESPTGSYTMDFTGVDGKIDQGEKATIEDVPFHKDEPHANQMTDPKGKSLEIEFRRAKEDYDRAYKALETAKSTLTRLMQMNPELASLE